MVADHRQTFPRTDHGHSRTPLLCDPRCAYGTSELREHYAVA